MKAEVPGSEVLEIDINNGHVGHLSGLRLGLESEVFMLDILYRYVGHLHGLRLRLEEGKVVEGKGSWKVRIYSRDRYYA